jgi:hypothetical protein
MHVQTVSLTPTLSRWLVVSKSEVYSRAREPDFDLHLSGGAPLRRRPPAKGSDPLRDQRLVVPDNNNSTFQHAIDELAEASRN